MLRQFLEKIFTRGIQSYLPDKQAVPNECSGARGVVGVYSECYTVAGLEVNS
jgi:hypothetical protein